MGVEKRETERAASASRAAPERRSRARRRLGGGRGNLHGSWCAPLSPAPRDPRHAWNDGFIAALVVSPSTRISSVQRKILHQLISRSTLSHLTLSATSPAVRYRTGFARNSSDTAACHYPVFRLAYMHVHEVDRTTIFTLIIEQQEFQNTSYSPQASPLLTTSLVVHTKEVMCDAPWFGHRQSCPRRLVAK